MCITYDASGLTSGQEAGLTMWHLVSGQWVNATSSRNPASNIICGTVPSLSWFGIGKNLSGPTFTLNRLKDTLWPPDHTMSKVAIVSDVADNLDPSPNVDIKVMSNETVNGKGDGKTAPDWDVRKVGNTWEVWVRAELSEKSKERIYTITATVSDRSGNAATKSTTVTVPHDKGKR